MIHKAKKSLGQNFLKSNLALNKIIEAGDIQNDDTILEIGPGKGALTEKLLEKAGVVIAVEKDNALFDFLKLKFEKYIKDKKLLLINGDILRFNVTKHKLKNYKIIANIPYNITGAILKKFLTERTQPERMILMVQHEVAQRIMARDKKESILSISVKAYGEPSIVIKVPARYFSPPPKVDSAVIAIQNISRDLFTKYGTPEEKFWEIVKGGFAHKRKKLSSNVKGLVPIEKITSLDLENKRAENLTLEDWVRLVS